MAKVADRYFKVDPWKIIEEGFDENYSTVAESIFSLGNEYMGIRGIMEEGYSGESLKGSYFNGVYERLPQKKSYKGVVDCTEYMVNSVNWLDTCIEMDGEILDLHTSKFINFSRKLDLKTGILTRSFVWILNDGRKLEIAFERFLSMVNDRIGAQKIVVRPLNFEGEINISLALDFSIIHVSAEENMWDCENITEARDYLGILATTKTTKQQVYSACKIVGQNIIKSETIRQDKKIGRKYTLKLIKDKPSEIHRIIYNAVQKEIVEHASYEERKAEFIKSLKEIPAILDSCKYGILRDENTAWWESVWSKCDIVIDGDELNQQGIRFCIFQMFQTYHGTSPGTNIGAKGLTGEAYNGNAFWDTETYCLPFYLFNNTQAARNLLLFRYITLEEARNRGKDLDCEGAFYPIATISGKECCNLWQHASLQLQASTAVAYGIWFYMKITGDRDFLYDYGIEMLVEISRMLATRGDFFDEGKKYGYFCVMGPDEFQMMVNHNYYTNFMGKFTLEYTLDVIRKGLRENNARCKDLLSRLKVGDDELAKWELIGKTMYLPVREDGLIEQHDGYFNLPHIDPDKIPVEEFPLYSHWSYDRIYRNDMIKQPDVLMALLLFNSSYTEEDIKKNYEFYEPRCIHESSLSPSVHSILANQLGKEDEAYDFFKFATRLDLDNYNRNSNEGIHTTSIAAAWMNIVYGFGGLRSDCKILSFSPSIPANWNKYSFNVTYESCVINVCVNQENVVIRGDIDTDIDVKIYNSVYRISKNELIIPLKARNKQ